MPVTCAVAGARDDAGRGLDGPAGDPLGLRVVGVHRAERDRLQAHEHVRQARVIERAGDLADHVDRRREVLVDGADGGGLGRGLGEPRKGAGDHEPASEPDDEQRLGCAHKPAGHPVHAREHALPEPVAPAAARPIAEPITSPRRTAPRIAARTSSARGIGLEAGRGVQRARARR